LGPYLPKSFDTFKLRLIKALILVRLDFERPFILDVDWFIKGVRSVLS
jgi:hypothetical protein